MTPQEISAHILDTLRAGFASWLTVEADDEARQMATEALRCAELNHAQ